MTRSDVLAARVTKVCPLQSRSWDNVRWVEYDGGGARLVSIPYELWDAGGFLLVGGDRFRPELEDLVGSEGVVGRVVECDELGR